MSDDLEPIAIDDRSGAERIADRGRAGLARIDDLVDNQRFDIAALLWMLATFTFVGCTIYTTLKSLGGGSGWNKVDALANTGGPAVASACVIGIGLSIWFDSSASRLALALANIVGLWVGVAGVCGIAFALHAPTSDGSSFTFGRVDRAAGVLLYASFAVLGFVVMVVALGLARRRGASQALS